MRFFLHEVDNSHDLVIGKNCLVSGLNLHFNCTHSNISLHDTECRPSAPQFAMPCQLARLYSWSTFPSAASVFGTLR